MGNNILGELHKLYSDDQLILFVGSGVSFNSDVATWEDLTNRIVEQLNVEKLNEYTYFDHLYYAESLFNKDKVLYEQILSEIFSMEGVNSSDLHKKIMDLNQSDIVTTNFDTLLEKSDSYVIPQYEVVNSDIQLLSATKKNKIIKMHGDISDVESIVLKESDYINYENKKKAIHTYLRHLFFSKTIVFIGYSLSDYNIKQILNDINNYSVSMSEQATGKKHYFLTYSKESTESEKYKLRINNLKKKNIECIDTSKYENHDSNTTLGGEGKAYYNFLCAIENYTMHKLPIEELKIEIIRRFKVLDEQLYISTNDIVSSLELKILTYNTASTLAINNKEIYNILKEEKGIISNVFLKTLLKEIVLIINGSGVEKFQIKEYDKRYKQILKQIRFSFFTRSNFNNQTYNKNHEFFVCRAANSESYLKTKNQTNEALLNTIRKNAPFNDDSSTEFKMTEKIQFIENSLSYEEKKQFKELLKIAKFEYGILSYDVSEVIARIKKETRVQGVLMRNSNTTTKLNYFDILDKTLQSIYIYPSVNRSATLLSKGSFKHVMESYAEAYLSPFKKEYRNLITDYSRGTNLLYGDHILEEWHIFAFSEMISPRVLKETIENANIEKIKANINITDILDYIENVWKNECNRLDKLEFVKNIVTFLSYIDKGTSFKKLIELEIEVDALMALLVLFPLKNIKEYKVSPTFCNKLFNYLFDSNFVLGYSINAYFSLILLEENISLLNEDNLSIIRKGIGVEKNEEIPQDVCMRFFKTDFPWEKVIDHH